MRNLPVHVLVVDEDAVELEKSRATLAEAGHRVTARSNSHGIRADILALRPDVVLIDPASTGVRGDDFTLLLGLYPETADVAVVFHCRPETRVARGADALGTIAKGLPAGVFLHQFQKLVDDHHATGLPKEDRAVIAGRRLSGTHRVSVDEVAGAAAIAKRAPAGAQGR